MGTTKRVRKANIHKTAHRKANSPLKVSSQSSVMESSQEEESSHHVNPWMRIQEEGQEATIQIDTSHDAKR